MSQARKDAWQALVTASSAAAKADYSQETSKALSEASKAWAAANGYVLAVGGASRSAIGKPSGLVIPGGKNKGTPIEDADRNDLEWWAERLESSLDDPDKARWRAKNEELLNAMKKELASR